MSKNYSHSNYLPLKIVAFATFFLCSFVCCSEPLEKKKYDVGVLALRGHEHAKNTWQPTMNWLTTQIPDAQFILHTYSFDELEQAFRANELDFLLTSPGQATTFARQEPLNWLATKKTAHQSETSKGLGSTVLVRHDSPYQSLSQIEKARIGAISPKAFGGFLAFRYELEKLGYFNKTLFDHVRFEGDSTDSLIYALSHQELDVAIVPVCTLEQMEKEGVINASEFRVLGEQHYSGFNCLVSSALYPNWTFAKTEKASMTIGVQVTQALLSMPSDGIAAKKANNVGWTLPESQLDIDNVYKHFDMHPLQKPATEVLESWLHKNPYFALLIIIILLTSNIYHFWLEYRFKRSKQELHATLEYLRQKSSMLEHAQRIMIVGELGSSLAHEINQPLSAINNYSQGAKIRVKQGKSTEEILPVLDRIQHQVTVASDIIQRLRNLINKNPITKKNLNIDILINETIKIVEHGFYQQNIDIKYTHFGYPQDIVADCIGIQQLLLNLLNNAKDACMMAKSSLSPFVVEIKLIYDEHTLQLIVNDNGIGIANNNIPLDQAFYTTKKNGLGLGLAICRDVVEAHQGTIQFQSTNTTGCSVTVTLPLKEKV